MKSKTEEWSKFIKLITNFVESFNYKKDELDRAEATIINVAKKFRPGEDISMFKYFSNEKYSSPEFFSRYIYKRKQNKLEKFSKSDYSKIIELVNKLIIFPESQTTFNVKTDNGYIKQTNYKDEELIEAMHNYYPWASDFIKDFIDVKQLFTHVSMTETNDTLLSKMLFMELYSLIDRLKVEAMLELSREALKSKRDHSYYQNQELSMHWNKFLPQDMIFNMNPKLINTQPFYFAKFDKDDSGWINFKYELSSETIKANQNYLYKEIKNLRNNFQHSYCNEFSQFFISIGVIDASIPIQLQRDSVSKFWREQFIHCIILILYELNKLDELYYNELRK